MAKNNTVGKWGEELAHDLLVSKGYAIVETNWHMEHYEIDIVAMHAGRLVFVEVKTRSDIADDPAAAVDRRKMKRMAVAADCFIRTRNMPHEVQFDIITISGKPDNYTIEHIADAFLPPLHTY